MSTLAAYSLRDHLARYARLRAVRALVLGTIITLLCLAGTQHPDAQNALADVREMDWPQWVPTSGYRVQQQQQREYEELKNHTEWMTRWVPICYSIAERMITGHPSQSPGAGPPATISLSWPESKSVSTARPSARRGLSSSPAGSTLNGCIRRQRRGECRRGE